MGRWLAGKHRLFVVLSLLLMVSDLLFIVINFQSGSRAMDEEWHQAWERTRATLELAVREQLNTMLMLARGYAADPEILRLVEAGRDALAAEGGEAGGPETARARQALHERLAPSWRRITSEFRVRQLHFHFGPGSLSFLRVHRPDRFGDRMDDVRHIIVDTIAEGTPRTGFETGRVYSGLRGVTPLVVATATGGRMVIGALEAGTSFDTLMTLLDDALGAGVAVLLRERHAADAMWSERIDEHFTDDTGSCACYIEARSRDGIVDLVREGHASADAVPRPVSVAELNGRSYAVLQLPLRDYLTERQPGLPPIGQIVVWRDVTERIASFRMDQLVNVGFALSALLAIELMLYYGISFVTRARDAAEAGDRAKSDFLAMMSHELRTPLNAIIGFSDLLKSGVAGPLHEKQSAYLEDVVKSGNHLLRNIDRILQYQTIDGDVQAAIKEPVDLVELVKKTATDHAELAERGGVRLTPSLPESFVIKASAEAVGQALAEILVNAIAVSPKGSAVEIGLTIARGEAQLTVRDQGPGFPPQKLAAMAQPFSKTQSAYRKADGLGIGLAIVRALMIHQRGRVEIENLPQGGAQARLCLPRT